MSKYRYREYRYRVVEDLPTGARRVVEEFASNLGDAQVKAAWHRRWDRVVHVERQEIVQPPAWERVL